MKERFTGFIEAVKGWWERTSKRMRIVYLVSALCILGVSLGIVLFLNRTDHVVLYSDMSAADNAAVIASLQEMNVDYVLDGNRLLINEKDELNVRMQLATKGYSNTGFDYDLFLNGSLTDTQFEKEQRAVYQLQDRLQATIETFPEVNSAVVNISMPESNAFVLQEDKTAPKASIKLTVKPGSNLSTQQIQGILNIVKNSVPGLEDENISIADGSGDLRAVLENGQDAAATKWALTEQVNETVNRRIMAMLSPLYGDGRVIVKANTVLDVDQRIEESTEYNPFDPEDPTRNPVDYYERAREKTGGTGFAEGVPGATDNVDVPQYAAEQQEMDQSDYYSTHDIYDYLVGSTKTQIIKEGLEITDMTVAVLIDAGSLPDGERDQIIDIVSTAAGVPNDKVSVQNIAFNTPVEGQTLADNPNAQLRNVLIVAGIALIALLIIVAMVLMFLARRKKAKEEEAMLYSDDAMLLDFMDQEDDFEPITIPETNEQRLKAQIKDLAESDPEIVAQLIKTWLLGV